MRYQPVVRLRDHQIVGVEAFPGLLGKDGKSIPLQCYISVAEERDLIASLTDQILYHLRDDIVKLYQLAPDLVISVNLPTVDCGNTNLVERITQFLQESAFPVDQLQFEIKESILSENPEKFMQTLKSIKNLGVTMVMDGFGFKSLTLSNFKRLPIDAIKIDRNILYEESFDESDFSTFSIIIALAHKLGLKVTACGVERRGQLEFVARSGCDFVQGSLFCRPLSAEQLCNHIEDYGIQGYLFTQPLGWMSCPPTEDESADMYSSLSDYLVQSQIKHLVDASHCNTYIYCFSFLHHK